MLYRTHQISYRSTATPILRAESTPHAQDSSQLAMVDRAAETVVCAKGSGIHKVVEGGQHHRQLEEHRVERGPAWPHHIVLV